MASVGALRTFGAPAPLTLVVMRLKEGQMNKQLWFTTSFFKPEPGEDDATNPGRYGKALAHWLGAQLEQRGMEIEGILPEDFGWIVMVSRKPFMLWIGCGNEDGSEDRWSIFVEAEVSLWQKLFNRIDTKPAIVELESHLTAIASKIPYAKDVAWDEGSA